MVNLPEVAAIIPIIIFAALLLVFIVVGMRDEIRDYLSRVESETGPRCLECGGKIPDDKTVPLCAECEEWRLDNMIEQNSATR